MFETEHAYTFKCMCTQSFQCVWVDLVSVWYPPRASSFDSQNAAWNMAASLAIMSWGENHPALTRLILRESNKLRNFSELCGDVKTKRRKLARLELNFKSGRSVARAKNMNVFLVECIYGYFLKTFCIIWFYLLLLKVFNLMCMFMLGDQDCGWFCCTFRQLAAN